MKFCYVIPLSQIKIAIADLADFGDEGIYITRINVPEQFRGQGHGTALLKMILEDADKEDLELKLEVYASGALNMEQLQEWYSRYGFIKHKFGHYVRKAKTTCIAP